MSGLDRMLTRVNYYGGANEDRITNDKYRSFQTSLHDSYQGENITFKGKQWRCLINRNKLSEEYDKKEISIDFESQMQEGSIFYWDRTNKYWLVSLQQYTEEPYFRGQIERCDYQLDIDGEPYWIYLRGPVENSIEWNEKHNISFNDLNYTLRVKITKNEQTNAFFERFKILKFDNHRWQVTAVDRYSTQGVLDIYLKEYFDNEDLDNKIEPEIIKPDVTEPYIDGPQIIHVFDKNITYEIKNANTGTFVINSNKVKIINSTETQCVLDVIGSKSTEFKISYQRANLDDVELLVHIESL